MVLEDPRVDAYIAKSADFAQPILLRLRAIVHAACPEAEEALKWNMPHFLYRSRLMCGMAAFKQHVALTFWLGRLLIENGANGEAMGQFGRITRVADLPSKQVLTALVRQAMALNEQRADAPGAAPNPRVAKPPAAVPDDLAAALRLHADARETFERFGTSARREYIDWITSAKREETRRKRLDTTIAWLGEGKVRNWRYVGG